MWHIKNVNLFYRPGKVQTMFCFVSFLFIVGSYHMILIALGFNFLIPTYKTAFLSL